MHRSADSRRAHDAAGGRVPTSRRARFSTVALCLGRGGGGGRRVRFLAHGIQEEHLRIHNHDDNDGVDDDDRSRGDPDHRGRGDPDHRGSGRAHGDDDTGEHEQHVVLELGWSVEHEVRHPVALLPARGRRGELDPALLHSGLLLLQPGQQGSQHQLLPRRQQRRCQRHRAEHGELRRLGDPHPDAGHGDGGQHPAGARRPRRGGVELQPPGRVGRTEARRSHLGRDLPRDHQELEQLGHRGAQPRHESSLQRHRAGAPGRLVRSGLRPRPVPDRHGWLGVDERGGDHTVDQVAPRQDRTG